MTIVIHKDVLQGTDEWLRLRLGMLTASEMHLVVTAKQLAAANNEKTRTHMYTLASQKVNKWLDGPSYVSEAMERGELDEKDARREYALNHAPVVEVGFITTDDHGFTLGCSPDGLVGDDGGIEIKCPDAKKHLQTVVFDEIPEEHHLQIQVFLLVTGRAWCDFVSYHSGMHLYVKRMHADPKMQLAIIEAARAFCKRVDETVAAYEQRIEDNPMRLTPTVRKDRSKDDDLTDSSKAGEEA